MIARQRHDGRTHHAKRRHAEMAKHQAIGKKGIEHQHDKRDIENEARPADSAQKAAQHHKHQRRHEAEPDHLEIAAGKWGDLRILARPRSSASAFSIRGMVSSEMAMTTHKPIRTARRTPTISLRPWACAAIGTTAVEKPEPKMKIVKKYCPASTMAASAWFPVGR